jgi:hypothetical protein
MSLDYSHIFSSLPTNKTGAEFEQRNSLFLQFDPNNNGYLSLAEVDKGIRDILRIDELFDCKPAIMRAFQAAKNSVKTKSKHGDDYVERCEFRLLLVYKLRIFWFYG